MFLVPCRESLEQHGKEMENRKHETGNRSIHRFLIAGFWFPVFHLVPFGAGSVGLRHENRSSRPRRDGQDGGRARTRPFAALGFAALALLVAPLGAVAHTFEPCLLAISERAAGEYDAVWRPPGRSSGYNLSTLDIEPVLPGSWQATPAARPDSEDAAATSVWRLRCDGHGLRGSTLRVPGIDGTQLDVVVRVAWLDQSADTTVLRSGDSSYSFPDVASAPAYLGAARYLRLGVKHILLGFDHLVFVLGLFLLVATRSILVKTITAFTLGHSLTLALAAFRIVVLPTPLTEALIALSIACIARELVRDGALPSLARRRPWLVALAFGLLHGLGFAAALDDLGFQRANALAALVGFNLGVELGQIAFVAVLLLAARLLRPLSRLPGAALALPYAIGSVAFVWLFERVLRFWSLPT